MCNFIGDINKLSHDFVKKVNIEAEGKSCYIRLERLYVNSPKQYHVVWGDATVVESEYYGLYIKYTLDAEGLKIKVIEKNNGMPPYKMGEKVSVSFDPNNILMY